MIQYYFLTNYKLRFQVTLEFGKFYLYCELGSILILKDVSDESWYQFMLYFVYHNGIYQNSENLKSE